MCHARHAETRKRFIICRKIAASTRFWRQHSLQLYHSHITGSTSSHRTGVEQDKG